MIASRYEIKKTIGHGGMGEVFLAFDSVCGRFLALKKIRTELKKHRVIYERFLREAKVTARLSHPAILPIYEIHAQDDNIYYTMPYIEGKTLKQFLSEAKQHLKTRISLQNTPYSLSSLVRLFISICQPVLFAHTNGILHRDLKPENVMLGPFGEVYLLDWGLAKPISENDIEEDQDDEPLDVILNSDEQQNLTHPGKIIGTLSYMAPEKAKGEQETIQTDIYALGVTFYQMLVFELPFKRRSLAEFKKNIDREELIDPSEKSLFQDIPHSLSKIIKKCLEKSPAHRYSCLRNLINDLEIFLEGKSQWLPITSLSIYNPQSWGLNENIVFTKNLAISQEKKEISWSNIMISKNSFSGNLRLTLPIRIDAFHQGFGFFISPQGTLQHANQKIEGMMLHIHKKDDVFFLQCYRNGLSVMTFHNHILSTYQWHELAIEKIDHHVHFYLDGQHLTTLINYLPFLESYVGITYTDTYFECKSIEVESGNLSLTLRCLSIPDAFLSNKNYDKAIEEYRLIASAFPQRTEEREALFRSGWALLQKAKTQHKKQRKITLEEAFHEFGKLCSTSGAPLEYLGKALIFETLGDVLQEINCLELACRKYSDHPMLSSIEEHTLCRMHTFSHQERIATYRLALLTCRFLPQLASLSENTSLFHLIQTNWELPPIFAYGTIDSIDDPEKRLHLCTLLSFYLGNPYYLEEIFEQFLELKIYNPLYLGDILRALILLNHDYFALECLKKLSSVLEKIDYDHLLKKEFKTIDTHLNHKIFSLVNDLNTLPSYDQWLIKWILIKQNQQKSLIITQKDSFLDASCLILSNEFSQIKELVNNSEANQLHSPLFFAYNLNLIHDQNIKDLPISTVEMLKLAYPKQHNLFLHFLVKGQNERNQFLKRLLPWEYQFFCFQGLLYYHVLRNKTMVAKFIKKLKMPN